jgi:hypothetical protein
LYTGVCSIPPTIVADILAISEEYNLPALADLAENVALSELNKDNVISLLKSSTFTSETFKTQCFDMVLRNYSALSQSISEQLSKETLAEMLAHICRNLTLVIREE